MNSKEYKLSEAERLYVYSLNTIEEVAERMNLSTKTICRWKDKYDWDYKRREFLKSKHSFHEELYELARKIMKEISADIDTGEKVDTGRMYALCRMLPMFVKVKDYEDVASKRDKKENENQGLTPDFIAKIEEEILGIPRKQNIDNDNQQ
ncbi:hypothetical protein IKQ21_02195 [bacterium]|nr:hypothetical protein [bacterium]